MSIKIGRFFGINLFVHWSFWLLPLWVIFTHSRDAEAGPLVLNLALLGALFGCVVLHEYGHALTARLFGIATRDVTLYPIGGIARLERISEKPSEEFWIAIAGPLVNVAIAIILGAGLVAAAAVEPIILGTWVAAFVTSLLVMNLALFAFNLLPAFPMDGGRVLRALLAMRMGLLPATRLAVQIGMVVAVLMGVAGLTQGFGLLPGFFNPMLVFVALFVMLAGQQELAVLQMRARGETPHAARPEYEPDEPPAGWRAPPRPDVTVYVWVSRKREWVAQGVIRSQYHGRPGVPG